MNLNFHTHSTVFSVMKLSLNERYTNGPKKKISAHEWLPNWFWFAAQYRIMVETSFLVNVFTLQSTRFMHIAQCTVLWLSGFGFRFGFGKQELILWCFDAKPKAMIEITIFFSLEMLISHNRWQFYAYTGIVNSFMFGFDFIILCSRHLVLFIVETSYVFIHSKREKVNRVRRCVTLHLWNDKSNEEQYQRMSILLW